MNKQNAIKANIRKANYTIPTKVKNLTIGFGDQGGDVYIKDDQGVTTFSGAYVTASGVRFFLSATGAASATLEATGAALNQDAITFTSTLQNASDNKLFGTAHATFYQTSVDPANDIPTGTNVNMKDYDFTHYLDWGTTDNRNLVARSFIRNLSSTQKAVVYRINFRYIAEVGDF